MYGVRTRASVLPTDEVRWDVVLRQAEVRPGNFASTLDLPLRVVRPPLQ